MDMEEDKIERFMEVGEIAGKPILYDRDEKKFLVTVNISGMNKLFKRSSEIALRREVNKLLETPPIKVLDLGWSGIHYPRLSRVTLSGKRLFELNEDGKKSRVSPDHFRIYDEEAFKELEALWNQKEEIKSKFNAIRNRLKKVELP